MFLFVIDTQRVHIAGLTPCPDESWMKQDASNVTMSGWGFLRGRRHLIIDRDSKHAAPFRAFLKSSGLKVIRLPPYLPNLNAYAELVGELVLSPRITRN